MSISTPTKSEAELALRSIRTRAKRIETEIEGRDRAIRAARRAGVSLRVIAEAAGVNHQTVQNILDRAEQ